VAQRPGGVAQRPGGVAQRPGGVAQRPDFSSFFRIFRISSRRTPALEGRTPPLTKRKKTQSQT